MPVGTTDDDALYLSIKPVLLQPPKVFRREHDDIMRFFRDCLSYFEVFRSYFQNNPSLMITFASSYFNGPAKDWWVHKRQEFWTYSEWDNNYPRFRYPTWDEFMKITETQFCDPAIEEVHKKCMFDLCMGNSTTTTYFQKLEEEAKLAGRWGDKSECRVMVRAV